MKKMILFLAVVSLVLATGCATTPSSQLSQVNTVAGPLQAEGNLNAVVRRVTTTVTKDADGKVISTTTEVVEDQAARNAADADHEETLAKIQANKEIKVARAQNPAPIIVVPVRNTTVLRTGSGHRRTNVRRPPHDRRVIPPRGSSNRDRNCVFSTKTGTCR